MEDALSRREYPAMLERLQPAAAVAKFNERVKYIGKVNTEIADWLLERRKVEDAYVAGLKKLAKRPLQDIGGDLGIFDSPWRRIIDSTQTIASSHATLSQRIEQDVEQPLRAFASVNREMSSISTIQGNLGNMAKELEDAQEKSDKLSKKGGKASAQKVENAMAKLQSATQLWESQAPFIFEKLQALDETRLNHLRDVLTQYETHEADQIEQSRVTVEQTLSSLLEIESSQEIQNWSQATVAGRPTTERKARQLSNTGIGSAGGSFNSGVGASPRPPPTPRSSHTDNASENSGKQEEKSESKFSKSRFGTMLGRRRQSIHGGFARAPSPTKGGFAPFGRSSGSRDGRPNPSPRASSNNLYEDSSHNRLSSLAESPSAASPLSPNGTASNTHADSAFISDSLPQRPSSNAPNGAAASGFPDLSDVQPPPGPPPSHSEPFSENQRDSEGFTVPGAMNDPISQAQQEAAQDAAQSQFKLDIQKEPIQEQDADAQAALSNVANTLRSSQMPPNRKAGTVRGRRDVRNTIFVPHANTLDVASLEYPLPPSPGIIAGRAATLATLSSAEQAPSVSDSTSIRSGHSLANNLAVKHAEMHQPGLNASIVETMHASIDNGETTTLKINGEIALVFNSQTGEELPSSSDNETIRINNFPNLEAIGENRIFVHPISGDKPEEFRVALASILSKPLIGFNYRVHVDEANITSRNPLLIKPIWKPRDDKFDFVVEYSLNPAYSTEPVTFQNLGIIARYIGGRPTACQSKPSGVFKAQQSCVYWRWAEITLTNEIRKLVCRLAVPEGPMPTPGYIDAKWEMSGSASGLSLSRLESGKGKEKEESADPFADDTIGTPSVMTPTGNWIELETSRKLVSGKFEAKGPRAEGH